MTAVRGPALHRGDCIGIAAPATHDEGLDISAAVTRLERAGYRVKMTPTVTGNYGFFSGTVDAEEGEKLAAPHMKRKIAYGLYAAEAFIQM